MERSIDDKMKVIQELRETAGGGFTKEKPAAKQRSDRFFRKMCTGFLIRFSIAGGIFIAVFFMKDQNLPIMLEFDRIFYLSEEEISGYQLIDFTKIIHYNMENEKSKDNEKSVNSDDNVDIEKY